EKGHSMKPVNRWVVLGMSLSIVLCIGMRALTSAENSKNVNSCTLPEYCQVDGYSKPTTTQPKPQSGMPTTQIGSGPLSSTVFIDGSGELFQTYLFISRSTILLVRCASG